MKIVMLVMLMGTLMVPAYAELLDKEDIDRNSVNPLGDKEFDISKLGRGGFTARESDLDKKAFKGKDSSFFSKKEAPGFGERLSLKMLSMDKGFKAKSFTEFDRESVFLKAQQRFDTSKDSPFSAKTTAKENDKELLLAQKRYQGRESEIIKSHLNDLQEKQFDKLDLDDAALSVEQIREMLNKD